MSSVAGAVVTIDGDSSGLVTALQKGEKGIDDVKQSAGKLSDQLREVADDADAAAGALVQKLGGPGAIKAIAGVTAGFAIAKQGVEAFLDSAENLFKSYGEEGQKVWDDTEKSLFAIKGAFAEAVLGGGDMEEMGRKLKLMFETAADVINFLLTPVRMLANLLWALRGDTDDATAATDKLNEAMVNTAKAQATAAAAVAQRSGDIKALYNQALRDIGKEQVAEQDAQLAKADAYRAGFQDLLGESALKAAKILAEGSIYVQDNIDTYEAAILELGDSPAATAKAMALFAAAGLEKELGMVMALHQASVEALKKSTGEGQDTSAPRGTGGAVRTKEAEDLMLKVQDLGDGMFKILTDAEAAAMQAAADAAGNTATVYYEMKQSEYATLEAMKADHDYAMLATNTLYDNARLKAEEDRKAAEEATKAAEDAKELKRVDDLEKAKAATILKAKQVVFDLTITQNAKMLAAAIVAEKSASDIARAAMGNVASGLGDLAMIKSGAYAAEGLFPQAAGMAVVGTTAYTIAGLLGADKKANAGPPTESKREQPVQNYAYNLRVDAAFADSESISRRFAQMQEGARARGLVPGMA